MPTALSTTNVRKDVATMSDSTRLLLVNSAWLGLLFWLGGFAYQKTSRSVIRAPRWLCAICLWPRKDGTLSPAGTGLQLWALAIPLVAVLLQPVESVPERAAMFFGAFFIIITAVMWSMRPAR